MKKEIFFKASRKKSHSCGGYRQIVKSGDLDIDVCSSGDDVISININGTIIGIDCNKKTGVYRLFTDV